MNRSMLDIFTKEVHSDINRVFFLKGQKFYLNFSL